jgi:glycosyltransferase involved in cell wall biosynthesis
VTVAAAPAGQAQRIAFLMASNAWGGAEIHTVALTARLAARGHECVIVELDEPVITARRPMLAEGVDVRAVRLGPDPTRPGLGRAYRFLRGLGADVGVFAKGWPKVGTMKLDLACRLAFRGRFLTVEHCPPPPRGRRVTGRHLGGLVPGLGLWWYAAGLEVYRRSILPKRIVTISDAIAHGLREYGFPAAKVVTIRNGVNGERFAPDRAARERTRAAWGVPCDAVVFGAVGRFHNFIKGHDTAIELFARLCDANRGQELRCVLVGGGPDEAALKVQARATAWADRIVFPGPTERPWEACSAIDVFLMPSRFEGLGLALLEAMACGCCPVAMGVGGVREVITDPSLGWIAPAADTEAFLRGMQAALDAGPDGRAAVGARARAHVLAHFDADTQYGKLADLVERI